MDCIENYQILIAEDDPMLRRLLQEVLLEEGYLVQVAEDGEEALQILQKTPFDLLLTDIHMPRRNGFSLLEEAKRIHPQMQRVLLTAYNVDEYMDLIHKQGVGNVLIKTVPFDCEELIQLVHQLFSRDIFGVEKHLLPETPIETRTLAEAKQIEHVSEELGTRYSVYNNGNKLQTVLRELITNAIFYGARNEQGEDKSLWKTDFVLADAEAITVRFGADGEKCALAITDRGGRLSKETILYWLNRQITPTGTGLPAGIFDTHGRGLFIARRSVDLMVVHVDPSKCCECIIINYKHPLPQRFRPLRIIEL